MGCPLVVNNYSGHAQSGRADPFFRNLPCIALTVHEIIRTLGVFWLRSLTNNLIRLALPCDVANGVGESRDTDSYSETCLNSESLRKQWFAIGRCAFLDERAPRPDVMFNLGGEV
jgi:hypothetical protein